MELKLADLRRLPETKPLPTGIRVGAVESGDCRAAWATVVDSCADAAFTQTWTYEGFLATADPTCRRAAWDGHRMAGAALCSIRRQDRTVGEVEELSVRAGSRRMGLGRALLLDDPRCLREHGAQTARIYTGPRIRTALTTSTRASGSAAGTSTSATASRSTCEPPKSW